MVFQKGEDVGPDRHENTKFTYLFPRYHSAYDFAYGNIETINFLLGMDIYSLQ